jgi:hypothetical protein
MGDGVLDIDLSYPRSYEVEELREISGMGKLDEGVFYIPRPKSRPGHDGLWLKIRAEKGNSWVGVFAFGYGSPPAFSRVLSSPDPDRLCIVSKGAAYIVKAGEPENWEQVPVAPVLDVRLVAEHQLLVFADFSSLAAYGSKGLVWQSPRVCWDELRIVTVTSDRIVGTGYDPTNLGEPKPFAVDIRTGRSLLPSPVSIDGQPLW